MHDLLNWIESLGVADPTEIKTKHDLATVVDFFKMMQVKYGSRWVSYPVNADFEEILITSPEVAAESLYGELQLCV